MTGRTPAAAIACLLLAAGAGAGADETVDVRIAALLAEAQQAPSLADAQAKLAEADKLLRAEGGPLDATARDFLQADILRTRGRAGVVASQRDATAANARQTARKDLLAALAEYQRLVTACGGRLDRVEENHAGKDPSGSALWRQLKGYISRAGYSEAWTQYNLGLIADAEGERRQRFQAAVERFSGFTAGGYRNHPIVADCFLGQGLCHLELRQPGQALKLLEPVRADNTPPGLFKRISYLRIKAAQAYGSHLAAETAAQAYLDSLPADHKLDAVELAMAVERARCLRVLADPARNPQFHAQFQARLDGVAKVLYSAGEPWRAELAKILGKAAEPSPFNSLTRARELFAARDCASAAAEAEAGLKLATPTTPPDVLTDLRYARAAALLNLPAPLPAFRAAAEFLRLGPTDSRSAGLCAPAVQAGLQALAAEPKLPAEEFLELLSLLEKSFADTDAARRAPWHRANLLLATGKFAEAEKVLQPIKPDSPIHLLAQYGLAAAAYKRAEALAAAKADPRAEADLLARAGQAVEAFLDAADDAKLSGERLQAGEAVVDIAVAVAERRLALQPPQSAAALALLDLVDRLGSLRSRAAPRRLAARLRADVLAGNLDRAAAPLTKLLAAPGPRSDETARTFAALAGPLEDQIDRLLEAGKGDDAARLGKLLVQVHGWLIRHLEAGTDGSAASRALAVRLRLAETLRKLGEHAQALPQYEWLVRKLPRAKAGLALRGLAVCCEQVDRYAEAAAQWAILARGLKKNTEGWYEARYHWILCEHRAGRRDEAARLLAYFRLQNPRIASDVWRARLDALAGEIGPAAPTTRPHAD